MIGTLRFGPTRSEYRRAQMRYLGAAAFDADSNAVPAEHFAFSTMLLPPGCEASHVHRRREVFFMIRGHIRLFLEKDGEKWETVLGERDLVSVPPGVYRGLVNERDEEALMCVMLGAAKPTIPTYPPDHPLAKIDRGKKK
jgi:quercetin dioxygenase-like cupin family protein